MTKKGEPLPVSRPRSLSIAILGFLLLLASCVGSALIGWAALLAGRFRRTWTPRAPAEPATLIKPLYGPEPQLEANLASFLAQEPAVPIQMLCGVQRANDPAIAVVERLRARPGGEAIEPILDDRRHGSNAKVSNLANMEPHIRHDMVVLSDSDMAVDPTYLARLRDAMAAPGVGAVSCLYRGRGDRGFWSQMVALGIDLHFLPLALIGLATGLAHPCMGSTIALRRRTLERIGGFVAFADILADDYAIGAAVRAEGLTVAIPDMLITHGCTETSLTELWRHELRWNATIAAIDPGGYAGSFVLHPLPLALIGGVLTGFSPYALAAIALALVARGAMALRIGHRLGALMLIPLRDILSFAIFPLAYCARSVDWRGARLNMVQGGRVSAETEKSE
ncbi:bacteriohopanetetrol glucosamine biosynthesis glycosyltransferase HpnI [Flavisphingomonas formosensis]|uniref:bacteriohopanetetrol glucosamine biosynthesis glycosyltransferase HpnI n=1 Tax=Flavisphingomonas formosensis TaxID=861534 RepID=UPI0012FC2040|nr:bacteriohopanetetrol glucosamine biosynthesis glycosyltransferase HpnI [Sphingomonas formosensis]